MHMNQSTQHDTYPRQRHLRPPPAPRKGADLPGLRGGPRECRAVGIPPLGGARGRFPFIIGNIKGPLISVRNLSLSLSISINPPAMRCTQSPYRTATAAGTGTGRGGRAGVGRAEAARGTWKIS